jgi:hypothetical protein
MSTADRYTPTILVLQTRDDTPPMVSAINAFEVAITSRRM